MVTFTLTPDNANDIPDNIVHLIVAEGVTEIPAELCYIGPWQKGKGIESLETVVFSKSVTVIAGNAFYECTNLKSVIFPNDSQLRRIGNEAFYECKSLQSIDIPDSVTIIFEGAFGQCHNLESVLFTDQSCLREIGVNAFCYCHSLQSMIIPQSVTEIGGLAFDECSNLKSVIFEEHSSIQSIDDTFCNCRSLQFINIPTTVTKIDESAFNGCHVLQVIDISHQAEVRYDHVFGIVVNPTAFKNCHLLSTTLEEHGTDCLKGRLDELPIHQTCYKVNKDTSSVDIINSLQSLQRNDPALLQVDIMGMTPLHILSANPAVTKDMIKQLHSKNIEAALVRDINDMLPWHMYVVNKDKRFNMFNVHKDEDGRIISTTKTDTARMILSIEFDADTLVEANLDIDTKEMYLILTGSSLGEWLETANAVTGFYPFMSMAKSNDCNLEDVYDVAMMNLNTFQRDCVL